MNFSSSSSLSSRIYIFVTVVGGNYIFYRIDAQQYLYNKESCGQPYNLRPLVVFRKPVLPDNCICVKLGSNFYFICGQRWVPSFYGKRSFCNEVYRIRESDLIDLVPGEHNTDGGKYLIQCASMNGSKNRATVFVAENKLYALAAGAPSKTQFEVYDPCRDSWKVLPCLPDNYSGEVTCYVVIHKTVYFNICHKFILSFHLANEIWEVLLTQKSSTSFQCSPPLVVKRGMAFGFVDDDGDDDDDDDDDDDFLTISATPILDIEDIKNREFMRPSIRLDDEFLRTLNSSRCPEVKVKTHMRFSDYMVALDDEKVLCVISYGNGPTSKHDWEGADPCLSYVTLFFFEVNPDQNAARCIKPKLLHTAQFMITTVNLYICGRIEACFS